MKTKQSSRRRLLGPLLLLLVALLACSLTGGGDLAPPVEPTDEPATAEPTQAAAEVEETPTEVAEPIAVEPVASRSIQAVMADVKAATVQIVADASLADVEGNVYARSSAGSGFIIDESGLVVTNNHVVTGARSYEVYVGGEDEPHPARLLGVSECSDLAVIDLEGDGYPSLEWHQGPVYAGLDVYAVGYSADDDRFTATWGIVSKEETDGQTSWASVEGVIQHDATINPGMSGGPLVSREGQVVAVNYANRDEQQAGVSIRYFAIARDETRRIVEQLAEGQDVLAVGINGQAFVLEDEEGRFTGIWVQSVQSGSVADEARLEGGDIITTLEGRELANGGTMEEYCDTLRSHQPDDALDIEVLRLQTDQYLEGQLNGRELVPVNGGSEAEPAPIEPTATPTEPADSSTPTPRPQPTATPSQAGGGGGLRPLTLWGSPVSGSIAPQQEQWFYFNASNETEATLIAFMQNVQEIDFIIYHSREIPVWPHHDPDLLPNLGIASEQGNRDQNANTREFIWQGPVEQDTRYYVRFINRGNNTVQYCIITRPDKYSCP